MPNSGALARNHGPNRINNSPVVRRNQPQFLPHQLQREQQRPLKSKSPETDSRTDSDESTLSTLSSVSSSSPPKTADFTNLDRLITTVTPFVRAQMLSEPKMKGKTSGADGHPYFCLGDLWDSFREWSVYGVGSPVLLRGGDSVKQYFAPSLSGIQLYIDPHRPRRTNGDSDDGSSRETCSAGSSDSEAENQAKGAVDRAWNQHSLVNFNSQRMSRLTMGDGPGMSSSGDERGVGDSSGLLVFQYFEHEQPRVRLPLYDKVSELAAHFPELRMCRSCDLMPASWVSVAWYPIYRIPMGPTLENLEVSFLTFHSLSTHCRSKIQPQFHASTGRKGYGVDLSPKISLPVFALAFCKLRGSILTPDGESEWQQANSLFQAAANWLRHLQVNLPDFQFFLSRWR